MIQSRRVLGNSVADIFVSYTSSDKDWAFWIGEELERLGHTAHVQRVGDFCRWRYRGVDGGATQKADHVLCVVSADYLKKDYSKLELHAAQWVAASHRPNFALPVLVDDCEVPYLLAPFKRCGLFGLNEDDARAQLEAYLKPQQDPPGRRGFRVRLNPCNRRSHVRKLSPFPVRPSSSSLEQLFNPHYARQVGGMWLRRLSLRRIWLSKPIHAISIEPHSP